MRSLSKTACRSVAAFAMLVLPACSSVGESGAQASRMPSAALPVEKVNGVPITRGN